MRKAVKAIILNEMPFDRVNTADNSFIHATGREIVFDDGSSEIEYEDYQYDNLPEELEKEE